MDLHTWNHGTCTCRSVNQSILDRWAWNSLEGCTKVQARKQKLFGVDMTYWTSSGAIQTHNPYAFHSFFIQWGWRRVDWLLENQLNINVCLLICFQENNIYLSYPCTRTFKGLHNKGGEYICTCQFSVLYFLNIVFNIYISDFISELRLFWHIHQIKF